VFAAGFGSRVSTLSLISYWISGDSKATLYAAIAVVENIGHAIGDPSLQQIFAAVLRLRLSPFWQALPFFVAAVSLEYLYVLRSLYVPRVFTVSRFCRQCLSTLGKTLGFSWIPDRNRLGSLDYS